jgi:hypothetical protein
MKCESSDRKVADGMLAAGDDLLRALLPIGEKELSVLGV